MKNCSQTLQKLILCSLILGSVAMVSKDDSGHNVASEIECGFNAAHIRANLLRFGLEFTPLHKAVVSICSFDCAGIHSLVFVDNRLKVVSELGASDGSGSVLRNKSTNEPKKATDRANDADTHKLIFDVVAYAIIGWLSMEMLLRKSTRLQRWISEF